MGVRRATVGPMEPDATPPLAAREHVAPVRCPWCGSLQVERVGAFGPQLISEQYMCLACWSPFERIRK